MKRVVCNVVITERAGSYHSANPCTSDRATGSEPRPLLFHSTTFLLYLLEVLDLGARKVLYSYCSLEQGFGPSGRNLGVVEESKGDE